MLTQLISVPPGAVLVVIAFFTFPKNATPLDLSLRSISTRLDWPGIFLSLGGITSLIYGLQQGSTAKATYTWSSWQIVTALTVQGVCWVAFVGWEIYLTRLGDRTSILPILPARLFIRRVIGSAMLYDSSWIITQYRTNILQHIFFVGHTILHDHYLSPREIST